MVIVNQIGSSAQGDLDVDELTMVSHGSSASVSCPTQDTLSSSPRHSDQYKRVMINSPDTSPFTTWPGEKQEETAAYATATGTEREIPIESPDKLTTASDVEWSDSLPSLDSEASKTTLQSGGGGGGGGGDNSDVEVEVNTDEKASSSKKEKKKNRVELQDQTNLLPARQVVMVFCGITCALFCSLLDQTIVTTALPTLGEYFNDADKVAWVGTAYLLTSTAVQPIYGRLSDIFGRKIILLCSLVIFLFSSLACALAHSMIELIIFRAFQGIGGGGITTLSMIIISDVVSLRDRGKYQGIMGGVVAVSNSVGPILGGIFSQKVSWRWCFYLNLPLTSLAIAIIFILLPLKRVEGEIMSKLRKLDVYGSVITLTWACLLLLGLSWAGTAHAWSSAAVLVPIILGVALLGVFIYVEIKLVSLPLIPMYIFRNPTVAASMATTFFNGAAFYATLYYLPQYFQVVRGTSPIRSGVLLLPLTLVQTICAVSSGFLVAKTGDYKWNLVLGFGIWTVGLGLMSMIDSTTSLGKLIGYQIVVGVGAGQTFQTSLLAIQAAVDRQDMAAATGCRNFLRMLGGTIALAACSAIMNNVVQSQLASFGISKELILTVLASPTELTSLGLDSEQVAVVQAAYGKAIDACFWLMVPLAGISAILTVFFIRRLSLNREDDQARKEEAKAWLAQKGKGEKEKEKDMV